MDVKSAFLNDDLKE
jgi:hypothetical protein